MPRMAPEITAPAADPPAQARAATAFTPARSLGVNDENVRAFHVADEPYMKKARNASAADRDDSVAGEGGDDREGQRGEDDADDGGHRAVAARDAAVHERTEAAGGRDRTEDDAERRERHRESFREEQIGEREEAAGSETEDELDGEEAREEPVPAWRVERGAGDRHALDEQDRDRARRAAMMPPPPTSTRNTIASSGRAPRNAATGAASTPARALAKNAAIVPSAIC